VTARRVTMTDKYKAKVKAYEIKPNELRSTIEEQAKGFYQIGHVQPNSILSYGRTIIWKN
jgi:hypothetical protein